MRRQGELRVDRRRDWYNLKMETSLERTERLLREFEESAGVLYIRARDLHKTSTYAFTENGRVLLHALKSFKSYIAFPGLAEQEETNQQHREILRHFQNFITSALALVDVSRAWRKNLESRHPDFCAEYDKRLAAEFKGAQDHLFIKDLRNYMSHDSLPLSASQGSFTLSFSLNGGDEHRRLEWAIVLDLEALRQSRDWSSESKAYLASCSEDINLLTIVEPYHKRVVEFYAWFHEQLEALHAADIEESAKLHKQLNAPTTPP